MNKNIDTTLAASLNAASTTEAMTSCLFEYLEKHGQGRYDECVRQLEHALQAAHLAQQAGATPEEITSALLHDIGHFLMDEHDQHSDFLTEDWCHEEVGAEQLAPFFDDSVLEPIRLHVPAKRYLCSVDSDYYGSLSQASQRSFKLQGGPMTHAELTEFESNPFYQSAVKLRRWDDGAKVEQLDVPTLDSYRSTVESCLRTD